mmetsp:Transcript_11180/g.47702  ORF Transcript_11180/g.47702 Transcript_11180/m.47702 type:complete len:452 (-) Transcript_11180:1170-2525(-)
MPLATPITTHRDPGSVGKPKSSYKIPCAFETSWSISSSRITVVRPPAFPSEVTSCLSVATSGRAPRSAPRSSSELSSRARECFAAFVEVALVDFSPESSSITFANTSLGSPSAMQFTAATRGRSARPTACFDPPPSLLPSPQHRATRSASETVSDLPVPGKPHTYTEPPLFALRLLRIRSSTVFRSCSRQSTSPGAVDVCSADFAAATIAWSVGLKRVPRATSEAAGTSFGASVEARSFAVSGIAESPIRSTPFNRSTFARASSGSSSESSASPSSSRARLTPTLPSVRGTRAPRDKSSRGGAGRGASADPLAPRDPATRRIASTVVATAMSAATSNASPSSGTSAASSGSRFPSSASPESSASSSSSSGNATSSSAGASTASASAAASAAADASAASTARRVSGEKRCLFPPAAASAFSFSLATTSCSISRSCTASSETASNPVTRWYSS